MSDRSPSRMPMAALLGAVALLAPRGALALEPLEPFVASAETHAFDAREARAVLAQRETEADSATVRLAPTLGVTGVYTRNQFEARVGDKLIVPENQLDLYLTANMTLVDVGQWERMGATKRTREAAESRAKATRLEVTRLVVRDYYQVVAAEAVLSAARRTLATAEKNLAFVTTRKDAGFAQELDQKRAEAEVAKGRQLVADATYQVAASRRALETDSGKKPAEGAPALDADLTPEAPLADWEARSGSSHPSVRAAQDEARAAERQASATRASLLPTLSVGAQNRFTNATGFQDRSSVYALTATVALKFDATQIVNGNALGDAAVAARIREEKATAQARDRVFLAWHAVRAQIDKAQAARAGLAANQLAARIARQRYEAGTATFLDVVTAERDAFAAEVTRIQADGDLLLGRADLRIAAGSFGKADRP